MALLHISCPHPLRKAALPLARDYALRDAALDAFHEGNALDAIHKALAFALPSVVTDMATLDLESKPIQFAQGSASVKLAISGGVFSIASDIAELPKTGKATAALRHLLTEVGSTGQYHQPRLYGDIVRLEFVCPVAQLHPIRLIDAIEKLALEADRNDHWMVARFGVSAPKRAPLVPLSPDELTTAYQLWHTHWTGVDQLVVEIRRKRSLLLLDAACSIASDHIRYLLPLNGELRRALVDAEDVYCDNDEHPDQRDAALAKIAKQMCAVQPEALAASLGHATYNVHTSNPERAPRINSVFNGERWNALANAKAAGRSMEVTLAMVADVLTLLTRGAGAQAVDGELRAALDIAHEKPWREVAEPLFSQIAKLRSDAGEADETSDDEYSDSDESETRR